MTRLISIAAWGGFFYFAAIHNTNWIFWLCATIVFLDRWIIIPFILKILGRTLITLAKEQEESNETS